MRHVLRPAGLLTLLQLGGVAGHRREPRALETDDDRVVVSGVLANGRVLGEPQLGDEVRPLPVDGCVGVVGRVLVREETPTPGAVSA